MASPGAHGRELSSETCPAARSATLLQLFKAEVTDERGKLSFARSKTRELLSAMFDEVVALFPGIDGFQVRVGEVYLQE